MSTNGLVFGGTLTQIVTYTDSPMYYIGQVFSGYYQYVSPAVDGTFYATGLLKPTGNNTLRGVLYLPFPDEESRANAIPDTPNDGVLKVKNGVVASFAWSIQFGDYYGSFIKHEFKTTYQPGAQGKIISGICEFSVPKQQNALP